MFNKTLDLPARFIFAPQMNRIYFFKALLLSVLLANSMSKSQAQNFDIDVVKSLNSSNSQFEFEACRIIANTTTYVAVAPSVYLLTDGLISKDKDKIRTGLFMAGSFALSTILTTGSKAIIGRNRPFEDYAFIIKRSDGGGGSMPSGHTSAAFCGATSLALRYKKWYVVVPAYLWASSVGYSRIYQGVHYPSDVFVGALVGAGSAWLGLKAQQWFEKKHGLNKGKMPN